MKRNGEPRFALPRTHVAFTLTFVLLTLTMFAQGQEAPADALDMFLHGMANDQNMIVTPCPDHIQNDPDYPVVACLDPGSYMSQDNAKMAMDLSLQMLDDVQAVEPWMRLDTGVLTRPMIWTDDGYAYLFMVAVRSSGEYTSDVWVVYGGTWTWPEGEKVD